MTEPAAWIRHQAAPRVIPIGGVVLCTPRLVVRHLLARFGKLVAPLSISGRFDVSQNENRP
jgi:hypothetical protein